MNHIDSIFEVIISLVDKEKMIKLNNSIKKNMAISTICKPISMIISFIYIPIILNYLGLEKYGIWATILTIMSWIGFFDIGIGNGLRNKLTESLSKKDGQSIKLVSSAYAFISVIMLVLSIVLVFVASVVNWNRVFGVNDIYENLTAVVIVSCTFTTLNFILSICKNVLYALQKAADVSIMDLNAQILNLIGVLIAMIFAKDSLFIIAVVYGVSMVIVNLVASVITYTRNREVRPEIKQIDVKVGVSITHLGIQFFIIQICALVLFTTDSFIISYLYGAADVTPYNTVNKIFSIIVSVFSALIAPIWSNVTKLYAEKKKSEIQQLIKKIYMIWGIFAFGAILLMIFFRYISNIWLGKELNYSDELIFFGAIYCIVNMWTNMNGALGNGLNILKEQIWMAVIQATINIPLSLYFAKCVGLGNAGILLGTNISLLISCITLPFLIRHKLLTNRCLK